MSLDTAHSCHRRISMIYVQSSPILEGGVSLPIEGETKVNFIYFAIYKARSIFSILYYSIVSFYFAGLSFRLEEHKMLDRLLIPLYTRRRSCILNHNASFEFLPFLATKGLSH